MITDLYQDNWKPIVCRVCVCVRESEGQVLKVCTTFGNFQALAYLISCHAQQNVHHPPQINIRIETTEHFYTYSTKYAFFVFHQQERHL